jgi:hypothetical protein
LCHEADALWGKLGMMLGYPLLYEGAKLLGFLHEFFRLGLRHDLSRVIVEDVALAPTRIKVARQVCDAWPQRKLDGFEGGLVMSDTDDPIPGTGNGYFGKLEDSIIGCGKLAIVERPGSRASLRSRATMARNPASSLRLVLCVCTR